MSRRLECSVVVTHCSLDPLVSDDPSISASWVAGTRHMPPHLANFCISLWRWGFAMLTRMVSISWPRDPPASASQSAGITGLSHCTRPHFSIKSALFSHRQFLLSAFLFPDAWAVLVAKWTFLITYWILSEYVQFLQGLVIIICFIFLVTDGTVLVKSISVREKKHT